MSKLDKLEKVVTSRYAKMGLGVLDLLAGGKAKAITQIVKAGIADKSDPSNEITLETLGEVNDAQTEVLREHQAQLAAFETRIARLEALR